MAETVPLSATLLRSLNCLGQVGVERSECGVIVRHGRREISSGDGCISLDLVVKGDSRRFACRDGLDYLGRDLHDGRCRRDRDIQNRSYSRYDYLHAIDNGFEINRHCSIPFVGFESLKGSIDHPMGDAVPGSVGCDLMIDGSLDGGVQLLNLLKLQ